MANYSYNGVVLPALPTWDASTYPYALVAWRYAGDTEEVGDKEYLLLLQDSKETVDADGKYMTYYESGVFYRANNGTWESVSLESYEALCIAWANYDVYYLDSVEEVGGTLYLTASEPVPVSTWTPDPASLLMGYRVGQILRAMRGKEREPVAYLYNGVRLPKLPEWDRETYPYALIFVNSTTNKYCCVFLKSEATVDNTGIYLLLWGDYYQLEDGAWASHTGQNGGRAVWANYDIYVSDNENYGELAGTLYLATSEPVPVYE